MDHRKIEAENIPERYVRGTLPAEEAEAFEQHFFQCSWCLERVQSTERILQGLRQLAADEESWSGLPVEPKSKRISFPRSTRSRLLLAGLFVAILLPLALKVQEVQKLRSELTEARAAWLEIQQSTGQEWEQRQAERRQRQETEAERRRLDEALAVEKDKGEELRAWLANASQPQVNTPVFVLPAFGNIRDPFEIRLPKEPGWLVLTLDPDGTDAEVFRASLSRPNGGILWTLAPLEPDYRGLLNISLHASTLPPGQYELQLESDGESSRQTLKLRVRPPDQNI